MADNKSMNYLINVVWIKFKFLWFSCFNYLKLNLKSGEQRRLLVKQFDATKSGNSKSICRAVPDRVLLWKVQTSKLINLFFYLFYWQIFILFGPDNLTFVKHDNQIFFLNCLKILFYFEVFQFQFNIEINFNIFLTWISHILCLKIQEDFV
jgi:hypothetical protein